MTTLLFGCLLGWFAKTFSQPLAAWYKAKERQIEKAIKEDSER